MSTTLTRNGTTVHISEMEFQALLGATEGLVKEYPEWYSAKNLKDKIVSVA